MNVIRTNYLALMVLVLVGTLLAGCARPIYRSKGYEKTPVSQLATLEAGHEVTVSLLDRESTASGAKYGAYEFKPRIRIATAFVRIHRGFWMEVAGPVGLQFNAIAGQKYELKYKIGGKRWKPWIENKATGKKVSRLVKPIDRRDDTDARARSR